MARTPNADIPVQEANSRTTDALYNEFAGIVDVWLNCVVLATAQATPTGSESDGDRYIVGTGTGVFSGHDGELAILLGGTWQFYAPPPSGVPIIKNLDDGADWECDDAGVWALKASYSAVTSVNGMTGVVTGVTAGKHSIMIRANAMEPRSTNGCAAIAKLNGASNQPDVAYLAFDPTAEEHASFSFTMPKSWDHGTITFIPIWFHPATTTNFKVAWKLRALAVSDDDTLLANFGTAQSSLDTGGTTKDLYRGPESNAITIGGTPAAVDDVFFDFYRDATDATNDTLAVDAYLIGIVLNITTNADTDA